MMIEEIEVHTNVTLVEQLGVKIVDLIRVSKPSLILSCDTAFSNIVSHLSARALQIDRAIVGVDLGVLKIEPKISGVDAIAFISTYEDESSEFLGIQHHLMSKTKELILVQIFAKPGPSLLSDFYLNSKTVQA